MLQRLEGIGEGSTGRFAEEQVNVFRHDDVAVDTEIEGEPDSLQREFEGLPWRVRCKERAPVVATESYEVSLSGFLKSFQSPGHVVRLSWRAGPLKPKEGLNGAPWYPG